MTVIQALVLGTVQGLTEFIPVSSSGHLVLVPVLLKWPEHPLVFDLILHIGTLLALLTYFKNDLIYIVKIFFGEMTKDNVNMKKVSYESLLGLYLIIGTVPVVLVGLFFGDFIENTFRNAFWASIFLLVGSLIMFKAERETSKREFFNGLDGFKSFIIGCFQSIALLNGMSRSGATIAGGMLMGLTREYAARFSFLLSIPAIAGATILKLIETADTDLAGIGALPVLIGLFSSFSVGYLAIGFLLKFLNNNSLKVFIIYRVFLAAVIMFLYFDLVPMLSSLSISLLE